MKLTWLPPDAALGCTSSQPLLIKAGCRLAGRVNEVCIALGGVMVPVTVSECEEYGPCVRLNIELLCSPSKSNRCMKKC